MQGPALTRKCFEYHIAIHYLKKISTARLIKKITTHSFEYCLLHLSLRNERYKILLYHMSSNNSYSCEVTMWLVLCGIVAIPVPSYFEQPKRYTRHVHPLPFRQIHTSVCYYQYSFFPMTIVLLNRLPADLVQVSELDSFNQESVRSITPFHK